MATMTMSGYGLKHLPTRTVREAARTAVDPLADLVSTGNVRTWDLFALRASAIPGAPEWADRTLDGIVAAAVDRFKDSLTCTDCEDVGFYGLVDRENTDILTSLLRRVDDGGYEQLTASGAWAPYEIVSDQQLEILTRDLAADLAEAVTAGASGLARRYWWPAAFLPPDSIIAAGPAKELTAPDAAVDTQDALDAETATQQGWVSYAVVDDLDPGAVIDVIRLRRGPSGPELLAYRNGAWAEAPDLLSDLQGVQPPPLVELSGDQLDGVLKQIDGGTEGSEDSGDPGEGLDEADKSGAQAVAAALAAAGTSLPEGGFPIPDREHLKKAVKAFGRAKNPAAAKRHIIKRARALKAVNLLPDAWGVTAGGERLGALLADAPLTVSPDPRAEKLRRYWSEGKGALKIRWGTPGDWTRCYRQLRKYLGLRAKGYCQNLHKRATGIWTGSRANPGGHRGRGHAVAASGTSGALSIEAALVAAVSTGRWFCPEGGAMTLKDGIYAEGGSDTAILRTLTAGGFPVTPPDDWFQNPQLDAPTPLTVDDDGRVYGHIATRDVAHIGLPGKVKAPKSRSNYAYFKTGQLVTASGKKVNVGQITLAGGHAPLQADAAAAVAHYDNTASAVVDVNCGDDKWGIWVAGALRPEVTPSQLRTLRASAPSGDWRPINGGLELVACCQVNVPGFPVVRAQVASGAITSLVAAGAGPLYARRLALMADAAVAERIAALESVVFAQLSEGLEDPSEVIVADGEGDPTEGGEPLSEEQAQAEGLTDPEEKPVSDAVKRAREAVAARKAAQQEQGTPATAEEPQQTEEDPEKARAERLAALRERVHGTKEAVAAAGTR
jgi:hypothetical protein